LISVDLSVSEEQPTRTAVETTMHTERIDFFTHSVWSVGVWFEGNS
jgi:hypothetical protein